MRKLLVFVFVCWSAAASEIAVTFDDLPVTTSGHPIARQRQITRDLIAHLTSRRIPAVGFVNTNKLHTGEHAALLEHWLQSGLELGNHTYSHLDLHGADAAELERNVVRGERRCAT